MVSKFGFSDIKIVLEDVGTVLLWSSACFALPVFFSVLFNEGKTIAVAYILTGLLVFLFGFLLKKIFDQKRETQLRHAFLSSSIIWLLFAFFGAMPFVLIQGTSALDALFESMSSITTTGLSVIDSEINSAPQSLVFWRSLLGWVGGMGIIVLALIGVVSAYSTSMRLFFAEGRDDRIKPNLKHTVAELWKIYLMITLAGALALNFAGMNFFDSLNYSMSAVSTSGANTLQDRLALQPNILIEIILTVLLVFGATNFALHYFFLKKKSPKVYFQSTEFKVMILFSLIGGILVYPKFFSLSPHIFGAIRAGFFHSFSAQLGGFTAVTSNYLANLDDFAKLILAALMFIGGSSGSTSGGIKVSRFVLLVKQVFWKVKEIALPRDSFFSKKFEGMEVDQKRLSDVNHFVVIYILVLLLGTMVLTFGGNSLGNSFLEASSAQANAGISVGITGKGMNAVSEITLFFLMWLGRLDIIPLFAGLGVLFSLRKTKDF